jgi:transcriptional regulator with XRE-family HTH domain
VNTLSTLRELRERRLLTQSELANELGVTVGAISQIERGISRPRFRLIRRICEFFNVQPDELDLPETAKKAAA